MPEKFDRLVAHIKAQYEKKGIAPERAESIAYATAQKQENEESDTPDEESADDE